MKCPKCGRINRDDALICWNCHARFSKEEERKEGIPEAQMEEREKKEKRESFEFKEKAGRILLLLGVALIIVLCITAYYVLGG